MLTRRKRKVACLEQAPETPKQLKKHRKLDSKEDYLLEEKRQSSRKKKETSNRKPLVHYNPPDQRRTHLQKLFYNAMYLIIMDYLTCEKNAGYVYRTIGRSGTRQGEFFYYPKVICIPTHLPNQAWVYCSHSDRILFFDTITGKFIGQQWIRGLHKKDKERRQQNAKKNYDENHFLTMSANKEHLYITTDYKITQRISLKTFKRDLRLYQPISNIAFDHQDRVLCYDSGRIYRYDTSSDEKEDNKTMLWMKSDEDEQDGKLCRIMYHQTSQLVIVVEVYADTKSMVLRMFSYIDEEQQLQELFFTSITAKEDHEDDDKKTKPVKTGLGFDPKSLRIALGNAMAKYPAIFLIDNNTKQLVSITIQISDELRHKDVESRLKILNEVKRTDYSASSQGFHIEWAMINLQELSESNYLDMTVTRDNTIMTCCQRTGRIQCIQ